MYRKNALNFFAGYFLSAFGYEFIFFVMTVHVYNLTSSALNVGIFSTVSFIPRLFSPLYGAIGDRYDRAKVFTAASAIVALLIVAIAFVESVAWIYSVWFVISIFAMMIMNVRTLIMTEIMTRNSNLQGNSTVLMILSIARIIAPFAGGLIAAIWTPRALLFLTSAIYFLATIIMTKVSLERKGNAGIRSVQGIFHDISAGITCIVNDHSLRYLAIIAIFWRLFLGLQISLFVVYVKSYFSLGSSAYGLFLTCAGLGSIAGSMIGPLIVKKVEPEKLIMWGMGAHYLTFAALGMIGNFSVALVTVLVSYVTFYSTLVGIHSIRDSVTRSEIRGRVYGSITAILTPAGIASMLLGGYLAGLFGVEKVMLAAGLLAFASLLVTRVVFSGQRIMIPESAQ